MNLNSISIAFNITCTKTYNTAVLNYLHKHRNIHYGYSILYSLIRHEYNKIKFVYLDLRTLLYYCPDFIKEC